MTMRMYLETGWPLPRLLAAAALLAGGLSAQAGTSSGTVAVTATVLSKNVCKFTTANLNIPFGSIDPRLTSNATVTVTSTFKCTGSAPMAAYLISVDDGLWSTGTNARRMRHATTTTEFIPYALSVSPTSGTVAKNFNETLTITGTVLPVDYQDRLSGAYSDTVVLTLTP